MAKSDDKFFRKLVERRQKDRWKTGISSDGYTLQFDEIHKVKTQKEME